MTFEKKSWERNESSIGDMWWILGIVWISRGDRGIFVGNFFVELIETSKKYIYGNLCTSKDYMIFGKKFWSKNVGILGDR